MAYSPTRVSANTGPQPKAYSFVEVQCTDGRMVGMMITASPSVLTYLLDNLKSTGFLHLFNDKESMAIASKEIIAVKITAIATGEQP